jgi:hypothetical protein
MAIVAARTDSATTIRAPEPRVRTLMLRISSPALPLPRPEAGVEVVFVAQSVRVKAMPSWQLRRRTKTCTPIRDTPILGCPHPFAGYAAPTRSREASLAGTIAAGGGIGPRGSPGVQ